MIFWFSLDGGCQEVLNTLLTSIKRSAFNHFAKTKWLRMISRTNRVYNALKRSRLNRRQTRWISLIMIKVYKYILVCTLDIYKGLQVYPCLHALVARDVSYSYCTCYTHHVYICYLHLSLPLLEAPLVWSPSEEPPYLLPTISPTTLQAARKKLNLNNQSPRPETPEVSTVGEVWSGTDGRTDDISNWD